MFSKQKHDKNVNNSNLLFDGFYICSSADATEDRDLKENIVEWDNILKFSYDKVAYFCSFAHLYNPIEIRDDLIRNIPKKKNLKKYFQKNWLIDLSNRYNSIAGVSLDGFFEGFYDIANSDHITCTFSFVPPKSYLLEGVVKKNCLDLFQPQYGTQYLYEFVPFGLETYLLNYGK